jgi:hypothetical protein
MPQNSLEVVRRNIEAYKRRDLTAFLEGSEVCEVSLAVQRDGEPRLPGSREAPPLLREVAEVWRTYEMEPKDLVEVGNQTAGLFEVHAEGRTGKRPPAG